MIGENEQNTTSVEIFSEYLKRTGRRHTQERFIILECALRMSGHFTADDVQSRLVSDKVPVAVGTVYSTLQLLCECGLLQRRRFDDGIMRFESSTGIHLHLHCIKCGAIEDVCAPELEAVLNRCSFPKFEVTSYSLTFDGLCKACRPKRRAKAKPKQQLNITTTHNKPKRK